MIGDELSPASRALLDAARDGMSPDAAAIRRVRGKIAAAVATGAAATVVSSAHAAATTAGTGTAATTTGTGTAATTTGTGTAASVPAVAPSVAKTGGLFALKLGVVGVLATVALGALALRDHGPSPRMPRIAPTLGSETAAASTGTTRAHDDAPRPPAPDTTIPKTPAVPIPPPHATTTAPHATTATTATTAAPTADLAREVELVDRAMAALKHGDARAALAAVHQHTEETRGAGQLAQDAAAIEIEALCRLGDPRAARKLAAFDARFPRSAQRTRLTTACP